MRTVFAVVGSDQIVEERVKPAETMKDVMRRVSQKLNSQDVEDLVLVYEIVDSLLTTDLVLKKLQQGKIPRDIRPRMKKVPMNYRFRVRSSYQDPNTVDFLIDIPQRGADPLRLSYASERRHCALATSAGRCGALSTALATLFSAISVILPDPADFVLRCVAVVFALIALAAVAVLVICHRKSEGSTFQREDYHPTKNDEESNLALRDIRSLFQV